MSLTMRLAQRARQARQNGRQPNTRATHASMMASIHRENRQRPSLRANATLREQRRD